MFLKFAQNNKRGDFLQWKKNYKERLLKNRKGSV